MKRSNPPSRTQSPTRRPKSIVEGDLPSSSPARDEVTKKIKVVAIERALAADPVDVITLQQLAISRGGLLNDELRAKAWPKLLDVDVDNIPTKPDQQTLHSHRDYNQVVLDVNRSLKRFPPGMEEEVRMSYQDQLIDTIMRVLVARPELHYYQGYHDIVVTFLLVVGEELTFALMDKLSSNHLRDFMDQNMDRTNYMLNYLYPIVGKANPELREFMEKAEVGTIFSLSWLITWYGHVLSDFRHIVRLYDYFIACHQLMPIYLSAAVVIHRQKEILACECEMCFVHALLSRMPDNMPFELLCSNAGDLFIQHPPDELKHEAELVHQQNIEKLAAAREFAQQSALRARNNWQGGRRTKETSFLVRMTFWTVTAALSAVAIAALSNRGAWEWLGWL